MSLCDVLKRDMPDVSETVGPLLLEGISAVRRLFLPVVPELEGDAEVVPAQQADDVLQLVL
jgi:hypothetical protein